MKISVFALPLLFSLQSAAQTVGVEGGISFSSYAAEAATGGNRSSYRSNISTTVKRGLVFGGHADFGLAKNIYLRTGLLMVVKGGIEKGMFTSSYYNGPYTDNKRFVSFDVPLQLLYKTASAGKRRWVFGAGLVPALFLEGMLDKKDLGAGLLAGYELPNGLHANLAYNHGLANVATQSFDYKTLRNRSATFTLGYNFRRKTAAEVEQINAIEEEPVTVQKSPKVLYAELGSPAGFLTLNYDTRLTKSNKGLGLRVGAGTLFDADGFGFTLPLTLNYLAGQKTHFFEVAAGASFFSFKQRNQDSWFDFEDENFVVPFVWAGYRYQPLHKKFFFRAGLGQPIGVRLPLVFRLPGLSFGYSIR